MENEYSCMPICYIIVHFATHDFTFMQHDNVMHVHSQTMHIIQQVVPHSVFILLIYLLLLALVSLIHSKHNLLQN